VEIDFEKLIRLQEIDSEIHKAGLFLESSPPLIEDIDRKIAESSESAAAAKDKMTRSQKKRRELEAELKDLKAQIGKYKRQTNDVKTNKEYSAIMKEIEESERKVDSLEEEFISEMLLEDDIQKEIRAANQKLAQNQDKLTREKEQVFLKKRQAETRAALLESQKESLLPQLPREQVALYLRLLQNKGGSALSPVTDDFCSMCHMRVRPQVLNELKEAKKVILCENCGRILYWKEKPEDKAEAEAESGAKAD
jgi:predicted  nucleic acid-binding Zn-ribbon protein